jgi:CRISPR-associated protein Csm4
MQSFCATLTPLSAFATPLKGDTLFGQLCWAIRNRYGERRLTQLLDGYTHGKPFAVISDAFPEGYLPVPKLPSCFYRLPENPDRKAIKKLAWLPEAQMQQPVNEWLCHAVNNKAIASAMLAKTGALKQSTAHNAHNLSEVHPRPHNTINRQTNTTGEGGFAPYSVEQEWFIPGLLWSLTVLLDESRISADECKQCLEDIGLFGYGKDASIGLGKFQIDGFQEQPLPKQDNANACLTLAPCAPQGLGFASEHSYYQLFTRFGRHGDIAVHQEGKPFKNPVLLAQTAAVFATKQPTSGHIGQGIGGNSQLSKTLPDTIHQGYAPVLPIHINFQENVHA